MFITVLHWCYPSVIYKLAISVEMPCSFNWNRESSSDNANMVTWLNNPRYVGDLWDLFLSTNIFLFRIHSPLIESIGFQLTISRRWPMCLPIAEQALIHYLDYNDLVHGRIFAPSGLRDLIVPFVKPVLYSIEYYVLLDLHP